MSGLNRALIWVFLVCAASVVRGTMPQVIQLGNRFKLQDVSDANLKQVLDSIGPMRPVVQELDLSGNALENFNADDLAGFKSLQMLDLSSNFITGVVNLSSLPSIQHLDLSNNYVSEVFVGSSIESLLAPNNRIAKVTCIGGAPKEIILANNRLSALSDLTSTCRSGVLNMDLSLNEITLVDFSELLQSRDTLSSLNLEYNFIVDVRNSESNTFPNLELLDVSSNKLVYLGEAFQAAENVRKFDASFNEIVLISHMVLFNRNLSQLDLRDNRFDCDTLRKFFRKNEFLYQLSASGLTRESCANGQEYVGPYCCESMPILFVDQLIEAKRKKVTRESCSDCERETLARRTKMELIMEKYRKSMDEERQLARDGLLLARQKVELQQTLMEKEKLTLELENLLRDAVEEQGVLVVTSDTLEMVKDVLRMFETSYEEDSLRHQDAEKELEKYERYIRKLKQQKLRLKSKLAQFSETYGIWM